MPHRWYVVHAYSGFENKVAGSIREQAEKKGLSEEISEVIVPTEEVVEVRRGSKVNTERKFFPGYVLVKMDLNYETWHLVKNTAKVTGFLGGGGKGKPVPISDAEARRILRDAPGCAVVDHRADEGYVTPIEAAGEDKVYISRLRVDKTVPNGLTFWCVSDNLRKGAALNAVQIAEELVRQGLKAKQAA